MQYQTEQSQPSGAQTLLHVKPSRTVPGLVEDTRNGLLTTPRALPPKYFYDDAGAKLFEQICQTAEYYPTRTEDQLLAKHSDEIITHSLPDKIIEFGSGSSTKTRRLLDACETRTHECDYAPFDVCEPALSEAASNLEALYEWLNIMPMVGDYHAGLDNLPDFDGSRLFLFLGGSIGNFLRPEAQQFLLEVYNCMKAGDHFLLGADRIKDTEILHSAYNDAQGITAQFNLNVLRVLNRELGADFDLDNFTHKALFNDEHNRIEMYLISVIDQTITLPELAETIKLRQGEKILTELSHKFNYAELETMLAESGFSVVQHFQPRNEFYSLVLVRK
ncbi:MAG: L-histidine N(alpha)-methyltransferase [Gammaproteobacteria bacterium]